MRRLFIICLPLLVSACLTGQDDKTKPTLGKDSSILNLARSSREAGDTTSAINLLTQQVMAKSPNPAIYIGLADMLIEQGRLRQAIEVLEKGRANVPGDVAVVRKLGNAYLLDGQPQKAEVVFDQGLAEHKNDSGLLGSKGIALDMQGKTEAAREIYQAAMKADPDNVAAGNNLAMSHLLAGEYDQAILVLEGITGKLAATPQMRQNLAFAYVLKGEDDKAMKTGLQDYSEKDMEKNLSYYRSVSEAVKTGKLSAAKVTPVEVKDTAVVSAPVNPQARKLPAVPPKKIPLIAPDDEDERLLRSAASAPVPAPAVASAPVAAPAAAGASEPKAEAKKWYVDLGNFDSADAARAHWNALQRQTGGLPEEAFGTMRQSDGREKLLLGPYGGFGDFKAVCDALRKAKVGCSIVQMSK